MRSSWERSFAQELDARDIDWEYEPGYFRYTHAGRRRRYHPDFLLPIVKTYVEIRPSYRCDDVLVAKTAAVRGEGFAILVCTEHNWSEVLEDIMEAHHAHN